jgi:hypothetical protein
MIRELIRPEREQVVINIPKEYIHKEVEVLVFPVVQVEETPLNRETSQNLSEFRMLMEQARKSDIKVPKEVDIDDLIDEINNDLY